VTSKNRLDFGVDPDHVILLLWLGLQLTCLTLSASRFVCVVDVHTTYDNNNTTTTYSFALACVRVCLFAYLNALKNKSE